MDNAIIRLTNSKNSDIIRITKNMDSVFIMLASSNNSVIIGLLVVYATDHSKVVVPVLFLFCVALWFILQGVSTLILLL